MFYLENNTTFSGADIKVYAYRDPNDFKQYKDLDVKKVKQANTNPRYPNDPFIDMDPKEIDLKLAESLESVASKKANVFEQKTIVRPDGSRSIIDSTNLDQMEKQYAAPVLEDLPETYTVTLANGNIKKNLTLDQATDFGLLDGSSGISIEEPQTHVTYADGTKKIVPTSGAPGEEDSFSISAGWTPLAVSAAPTRTDQSNVQTNKVNPNYIDIVKQGSDKQALKLAREYQQAKANAQRNNLIDSKGNSKVNAFKPIIELGSLYSITYSSFREKNAIRTLGRVSAKGYTRGQRTIAGSMNFAVFQSHELMDFLSFEKTYDDNGNTTGINKNTDIALLDQLPKFNLMMIMINEYGGASILHLFGVTISTESQQSSVEDLALMNNVTFYAEDIITIENAGNIFETSLSMLHPTIIAGKTLRFYNKDNFTTLGSLLSIQNNEQGNSKIDNLLRKSRGLF